MKQRHFHPRHLLAMLLALVLIVGIIPMTTLAAEQPKQGDPGTVTETFIDESNGVELAPSQTVASSESKTPQSIVGYVYQSYSTVKENVYAKEDLTYIIGYPDHTVQGERYLSRAEAATIFYRLYDGFYPKLQRQMTSATFSDVPQDAWYHTELEMCYNVGLVNDSADGTFRPNDPITRAEFAVMAFRFAGLANSDKQMFTDVTKDNWFYLEINAAAEAGWIQGYGDGTFRPDTTISRSEVVTLINHLLNRAITVDELKALGVVNPYTDLVESYWAYSDLIEATVKHYAADWHDLNSKYSDMNVSIEKYVDLDGNEIAEQTVTPGLVDYAARQFDRHYYLGYITTTTYVYKSGDPKPGMTKASGVSSTKIGDTLTYTITLTNAVDATDAWRNVVLSDALPQNLTFVHGSVYLDGKSAEYTYSDRTLTVNVGDIEIGGSVTVKFDATVASTAYGQTITNTATAIGDNGEAQSATDDGVAVAQGEIEPMLTKAADPKSANVGQTVNYTLTVGNGQNATYPWQSAVVSDTLPEGLVFVDGSVYLDGGTAAYTMKDGVLSIALGDIAPGESHTLTFKAAIADGMYGKTICNIAIGSGDNIDDVQAPDEGVVVSDGVAIPTATKSASVSAAKVGDTITYTVVTGNSKAATVAWANAAISDVLPDNLTFVYGSVQINGKSAEYSYTASSRELKVTLGDIAPGDSVRVTFAVTIGAGAYGKTIRNVAVLSGDNITDFEAPDTGVTVGDGVAIPSATKSADKHEASVGDSITYTVVTSNDRDATVDWRDVVLTDELPSGLSFSHGSVQVNGKTADYSYSGGKLTVNLGNIALGSAATVTFAAVVNSTAYGQTIKNTAILNGSNVGPVDASDEGVTVGKGASEGTATKTASVEKASVGDTITYTVTAHSSNLATGPWENAKITDEIPQYLNFVEGSIQIDGKSSNSYSFDGKTLIVYLGDLAPSKTVTVTFRATVAPGAQGQFIVNTAVITGDNLDPMTVPDRGVEIDDGKAMPSASKKASMSEAQVGDVVTYTIDVSNNIKATADWKDIVITDVIPADVSFIPGSVYVDKVSTTYGYDNRVLTVRLGDLIPGEAKSVTFQATVLESAQGVIFLKK